MDVRRLLDGVCDIVVAVPVLARALAEAVLSQAALLARLADAQAAARPARQPAFADLLGAFAQAMPEVRAREAVPRCCIVCS